MSCLLIPLLLAGLSAPADVHVRQVQVGDGRQNVLTWAEASDTAVLGYRVLRQAFGEDKWDTLGTAAPWHTRYVDDRVDQAARYRYRVVGFARNQREASEPTDYVPEPRPVNIHLNILLTLALAVIFGTFGARLFKRLKVPQVVAFIVIGLGLGAGALGIIDDATIEGLTPLSLLALGIIGFTIGGELRVSVFRRHGRKAIVILLAEGLGAFVVVTVLVGVVSGNWPLALILGAIASATAPAATASVLWEYRALGVLTTMILAIVAMDDGLALLLYGFASSIARTILGRGGFALMTIVRPLLELLGSMALGAAVAVGFKFIYRHVREKELTLAFALGSIMLLIGVAQALEVDLILAAMVFGAVFVNIAGKAAEEVFDSVRRFSPPIYVLFFVLVGAHLKLGELSWTIGLMAVLFVVGRTAGKTVGVWLGARMTRAAEVVRKYLGLGLLSQAGVAIGLAIMASHTFAEYPVVANTVLAVIATTTFVLEILGPPMVRFAVTRAGEVGRNVTEEDLLAMFRVGDVMKTDQPSISLHAPLNEVMDAVAQGDAVYFPVVDSENGYMGVITLEGLKATLNMPHVGPLLVAQDLMEQCEYTVSPETPLSEARQLMRDRQRDYIVVVDKSDRRRMVGFLIDRRVQRVLEEEIARRRRAAEPA